MKSSLKCVAGRSAWQWLLSVCLLLTGTTVSALEQTGESSVSRGGSRDLTLMVNGSGIVSLASAPGRITVANPEVVDVSVLGSGRIFLLGKRTGSTAVMALDKQERLLARLHIEVTPDLNLLKKRLYEVMPKESIAVRMSGQKLILSGEVDNLARLHTALKIAEGVVADPEQVVNMLTVGGAQQVMLEVKVAEMQRSLMKRLDMNFNGITNGGKWSFGGVGPGGGTHVPGTLPAVPPVGGWPGGDFTPNPANFSSSGLFANFISGDSLFNLYIDASKDTGTARILAEPTLTTLSGEDASFISGGEFPVPVPQEGNSVTVEFKEYGIGLNFLPVVMDSGRINLRLNLNVSEMNSAQSVVIGGGEEGQSTFVIPYLSKRSARSTVELMDGQTIGVAGLISENMRDAVQKFPGLGDVPVLGHLFRSQEYQSGQTELVILVTPRLAAPLSAEKRQLPTDTFVPPSDVDFYLSGNTGRRLPLAEEQATTTGIYGHDLRPEQQEGI
ncbi:type II and III secretion system protein family protein [Endozoicomonas sp.]|uniref:type II and III secretion system protein family protein n=1 Tax=Endozoicomonas sp. TaxID=1892382 RepID=UPI003AF4F279